MTRVHASLLALLVVITAAAPVLAAGSGSEEGLRRRVKRFYVLNYLNRYGEMWEMFSEDLRERLGGERQDYVKTSRRSGFELYSSRIEEVRLKGDVAAVEVTVQAQLAGMFDVSSRRHRMLWRFEKSAWRYAGSIDITHEVGEEAPIDAADLQPPSRARPVEVEAQELLPRRVRVESQAPAPKGEARAAESQGGERWDLVAVPPPGREKPPTSIAQGPSEPADEPPPPTAEAVPKPVEPERRAAAADDESPEWLPPELASAPPDPPPPQPGRKSVGSSEELNEGSQLVRKAVKGTLPRRTRALNRLRGMNEPRLAPLMARSLPDAPVRSAEVFLAELARYRAHGEVELVLTFLESREVSLRTAAARALMVLGEAVHAEALAAALAKETEDSAYAQELLAHAALAGEAAGPRIAAVLADEKAATLSRAAAARAAGACGCAGVEEPLLALLRRERKAAVSRVGLLAAGSLGGESSLAFLEEVAEQRLRLPAQASDDLDGVLEARRGLARAGVAGSGDALAALLLDRGMRAFSEDVVLVASTGELEALLSLLGHPEPAIRRRTADLLGRVIETEEEAARALEAIAAALIEERDRVSLDALLDARERLQAKPAS